MAKRQQSSQQSSQQQQANPLLLDFTEDEKVRSLEAELAEYQRKLTQAQARLDAATTTLTHARDARDTAESRYLAGRIAEAELRAARAAYEQAQKAHAIAFHDHEDIARMVRLLPEAITEAKHAARAQVRDNLRAQVGEKARQLAVHLQAAKHLSDELRALHEQAIIQFPVNNLLRLQVTMTACEDLGEEYGFVTRGAGVPDLSSPWLTACPAGGKALYDFWLAQLRDYLERLPGMAEADERSRASMLEYDRRMARESVARELAQRKLEAIFDERRGMPRGTVVE